VQHELVEAERRIRGRTDAELTSRAGYAGLSKTIGDKVCYHNPKHISDYRELGRAKWFEYKYLHKAYPTFVSSTPSCLVRKVIDQISGETEVQSIVILFAFRGCLFTICKATNCSIAVGGRQVGLCRGKRQRFRPERSLLHHGYH
jgi:hypothetical protein